MARWLLLLLACVGGEDGAPGEGGAPGEEAAAPGEEAASERAGPPLVPEGPADIVLVVVDGLRADRLDAAYMPATAAWAADATRYTAARSPAGWALPAAFSLLSGQAVHEHGVGRDPDRPGCIVGPAAPLAPAPAGHRGLLWGAPWPGVSLERFDGDPLAALDGDLPTFLVVHRTDLALPWDAPDPPATPDWQAWIDGATPTPEQVAWVRAAYDGEVAALDQDLGPLLTALSARPEPTWVVLVATTGVALFEGGQLGAGGTLAGPVTRVPLVVDGPGVAGGQRDGVVGLVDLAGRVAAWAGGDRSATVENRDGIVLMEGLLRGPASWSAVDGGVRLSVRAGSASSGGQAVLRAFRVLPDGHELPAGPGADRARLHSWIGVHRQDPVDISDRPCVDYSSPSSQDRSPSSPSSPSFPDRSPSSG